MYQNDGYGGAFSLISGRTMHVHRISKMRNKSARTLVPTNPEMAAPTEAFLSGDITGPAIWIMQLWAIPNNALIRFTKDNILTIEEPQTPAQLMLTYGDSMDSLDSATGRVTVYLHTYCDSYLVPSNNFTFCIVYRAFAQPKLAEFFP